VPLSGKMGWLKPAPVNGVEDEAPGGVIPSEVI
jgi:hypothetical protein